MELETGAGGGRWPPPISFLIPGFSSQRGAKPKKASLNTVSDVVRENEEEGKEWEGCLSRDRER